MPDTSAGTSRITTIAATKNSRRSAAGSTATTVKRSESSRR